MNTYWIYAGNWKTQLDTIRAASITVAHELAKRAYGPGVVTSARKFTFNTKITYLESQEQAA